MRHGLGYSVVVVFGPGIGTTVVAQLVYMAKGCDSGAEAGMVELRAKGFGLHMCKSSKRAHDVAHPLVCAHLY